jgi:hypothetical protein
MYSRGQKHLKKKNTNRKKRVQQVDEEYEKTCTFSPNLEKGIKKPPDDPPAEPPIKLYRSLSPTKKQFSYVSGCNLGELKEKCTLMHSYLSAKLS